MLWKFHASVTFQFCAILCPALQIRQILQCQKTGFKVYKRMSTLSTCNPCYTDSLYMFSCLKIYQHHKFALLYPHLCPAFSFSGHVQIYNHFFTVLCFGVQQIAAASYYFWQRIPFVYLPASMFRRSFIIEVAFLPILKFAMAS